MVYWEKFRLQNLEIFKKGMFWNNDIATYLLTFLQFLMNFWASILLRISYFAWNPTTWTTQLYKLTEKREKGPLHGLPFSVKEHFFIKGKDSTVGLYSRIGQPATENAQISKYLLFWVT